MMEMKMDHLPESTVETVSAMGEEEQALFALGYVIRQTLGAASPAELPKRIAACVNKARFRPEGIIELYLIASEMMPEMTEANKLLLMQSQLRYISQIKSETSPESLAFALCAGLMEGQ